MPSPPTSGQIPNREALGHIIRYTRMQAGMTVEDAALSIGVAKATLLRVEQGKAGVQFDNLLKIVHGLGLQFSAMPVDQGAGRDMTWPTT